MGELLAEVAAEHVAVAAAPAAAAVAVAAVVVVGLFDAPTAHSEIKQTIDATLLKKEYYST